MAHVRINPSTHDEWLQQRMLGIGGSDVGTILGVNKYKTPYQLWMEKTGQIAPAPENTAMKMGHMLEPVVSDLFEETTGYKVLKSSEGDWLYADKDKPFLRSSPDRIYKIGNSRKRSDTGLLECKTTLKAVDKDDIPQSWFCQVQYNLGIAELQNGALAWLSSGRDFDYINIPFKKEFYEWMVEQVEKFWIDNVIGMKAPEAISVEDVISKYPVPEENTTASVSQDVFEASVEYRQIQEKMDELKERQEELKSQIASAFGMCDTIEYNGVILATYKATKGRTSFDGERFKKDYPQLYSQYTKTGSGSRRLLFK